MDSDGAAAFVYGSNAGVTAGVCNRCHIFCICLGVSQRVPYGFRGTIGDLDIRIRETECAGSRYKYSFRNRKPHAYRQIFIVRFVIVNRNTTVFARNIDINHTKLVTIIGCNRHFCGVFITHFERIYRITYISIGIIGPCGPSNGIRAIRKQARLYLPRLHSSQRHIQRYFDRLCDQCRLFRQYRHRKQSQAECQSSDNTDYSFFHIVFSFEICFLSCLESFHLSHGEHRRHAHSYVRENAERIELPPYSEMRPAILIWSSAFLLKGMQPVCVFVHLNLQAALYHRNPLISIDFRNLSCHFL